MLNLYNINIHSITKSITVSFFPIFNKTLLNDLQVWSGGFLTHWVLGGAINDSSTLL
jgi:hypothetical protein